jgi:hypothetical protein
VEEQEISEELRTNYQENEIVENVQVNSENTSARLLNFLDDESLEKVRLALFGTKTPREDNAGEIITPRTIRDSEMQMRMWPRPTMFNDNIPSEEQKSPHALFGIQQAESWGYFHDYIITRITNSKVEDAVWSKSFFLYREQGSSFFPTSALVRLIEEQFQRKVELGTIRSRIIEHDSICIKEEAAAAAAAAAAGPLFILFINNSTNGQAPLELGAETSIWKQSGNLFLNPIDNSITLVSLEDKEKSVLSIRVPAPGFSCLVLTGRFASV